MQGGAGAGSAGPGRPGGRPRQGEHGRRRPRQGGIVRPLSHCAAAGTIDLVLTVLLAMDAKAASHVCDDIVCTQKVVEYLESGVANYVLGRVHVGRPHKGRSVTLTLGSR